MSIKFNQVAYDAALEKVWLDNMDKYNCEFNTEEAYEELLNETCDEIKIGELTYQPGRALKELDPIAFRCGMADESDSFYERFEEENDKEDFREEALQSLDMLEEEN